MDVWWNNHKKTGCLELQEVALSEIKTSSEGWFNNSRKLPCPLDLVSSQVTEAIVDVALSENRRFAVVPCCVFAERFAHRELEPGGSEITMFQEIGKWFWVWLNIADDRNPL